MKILYISTARIPDNWAHTQQIAKTCEALAKAGAEVELVVPKRHSTTKGNPFLQMGIAPIFTIRRLWSLDIMKTSIPMSFSLMTLTFFFSAAWYLWRSKPDAIYVRGELVLPFAFLFGIKFPIFWETHERPGHMELYKKVLDRIRGVITITEYYRRELIQENILSKGKVICAPDAVDLTVFDINVSKREARTKLNISNDRIIVLYTGSDLVWKGVQTLRNAAILLQDKYLVIFVGNIKQKTQDVRKSFPGFRPRIEIPLWLAAADVLVLMGTKTSTSSKLYTSPMKLFEYLAAGRVIVASDLPSFREILNEDVAYFAEPDDEVSLASAICSAAKNSNSEVMALNAKKVARHHSWDIRARCILDFINTLI